MTSSNFKYKTTTALYKIKKLLRNKNNTYVIQGGQGAGKTISILMIIIDYAVRNKDKEISIVSAELSKMKKTIIRDFLKILKDWNFYNYGVWNKTDYIFKFKNGTYIEFIGLDKHDVGKGMRRDIIYNNEANKSDIFSHNQVSSRSKLNIIDFNPDEYFWGHELINDTNYINLTFKDNECLPIQEVNNILAYKEKGYNEDGTIKNEFWANWWRVYGLGEIGQAEGCAFSGWKEIDYSYYVSLNLPSVYAIDWGSSDPFAIAELKYDAYNNNLYINELHYESEKKILDNSSEYQKAVIRQNGGIIPYVVKKIGIDKSKYLVCDPAVPDNIQILRDLDYKAYGASKPPGSILAGVMLLNSTNVHYTKTSLNLKKELTLYTYKKDRLGFIKDEFVDKHNHLIDAIRYGRNHFKLQ